MRADLETARPTFGGRAQKHNCLRCRVAKSGFCEGLWPRQATAQLKLDQEMKLEFWQELAGVAVAGQVLGILHGDFTVSLRVQHPGGTESMRVGLASITPFLVEG